MINPAATKRAALDWMAADDGLRFQVLDAAGRSLRIDAWGGARLRHGDRRASAAPLLSLLEDERASSDADGSLLVPHAVAAGWDAHQIAQLGLPPVAPFRLSIQGHGILSSPGFRFRYRLETDRGRAVVGAARQGVILQAGARSYTLLDPLYALIDGMDRYNAAPPDDVDSRFAAWGEMQALLPEDAVVDRHLRSMTIVRADALTLDPRADDNFDPVLLAKAPVAPEDAERGDAPAPRELLTPAAQRHFATRFEHFPDAKRRYALEGNWFVMVPEPVRKVLDVVRAAQREPPERRRAFLANPFAEISDRLSGQPEPGAVEALFQETPAFLSRRVERLGEWRPKAKAFVSDTGTIWFPDDFAGAEEATSEPEQATPASADATGDSPDAGLVHATPDELPRLIDQIQQGRAAGQATVDWKGQPVPTDPATEKRLAALVPVIKDNLEALDFVATPRSVQGDPGGLPANLSSTLYPHQQAGLDWLQAHWASGSPGCLLADDMGLGKTLQTLAFLSWVRERCPARAERKPHLVVAPTGLLRNWEAEAEQHLADPWLGDLVRAYGPELRQLRGQPGNERRRYLRDRAGWVLTTYETLRDRIALFVDVPWRVLVFDEAQRIKNPGARVTDMAKSLDAELTVALTGTPVENSLTDLWSIIDTVQPGALGSHTEFKSTYAKPAEADVAALEPLRRKLEAESTPQILLRRMKQDHLRSLPVKHECTYEREMPTEQADAYRSAVAAAQAAAGRPGSVLEALQGLRRVSLLPDAAMDEGLTDSTVRQSARLSALLEILDKVCADGEKALVFVDFLKIQEALVPYLRQRYGLPRDALRIYGGTPSGRRKQHVDAFQHGAAGAFDVMLLSPKAAGVGLTLTAANHVIHLSRWWNPAVEDQCTDRVYRIGQQRDVHVHLPIAVHPTYGERSFDANLHRLLEKKRALSMGLFAPPAASAAEIAQLADDCLSGARRA